MSNTPTRVLCIGGPLDGHTVPDDGHPEFDAVNLKTGKPSVLAGAEMTNPPCAYTRRWISCDGQPAIYFYTAHGVNEYAAIVRVFTAYAKPGKVGK